MKITDAELREAARQAEKQLLSQLPPEEACRHEFSPEFEEKMTMLIEETKRNQVKQRRARLGWQIYTRNGIAAVFLCFLLAFVTVPEAVIAGCERVIEVVETIFEEYTEFRYTSNAASETKFYPLKLGYIPDGMEEVEREEYPDEMKLLYRNEAREQSFRIHQILMTNEEDTLYTLDTEDVYPETIRIQNAEVRLTFKENDIYFTWLYGACQINGQTNLAREELITILEQVEFPQE